MEALDSPDADWLQNLDILCSIALYLPPSGLFRLLMLSKFSHEILVKSIRRIDFPIRSHRKPQPTPTCNFRSIQALLQSGLSVQELRLPHYADEDLWGPLVAPHTNLRRSLNLSRLSLPAHCINGFMIIYTDLEMFFPSKLHPTVIGPNLASLASQLSSLTVQFRGPLGAGSFNRIQSAIDSLSKLTQLTFGCKGCYSSYGEYPKQVKLKLTTFNIQVLHLENFDLDASTWAVASTKLRVLSLRQSSSVFNFNASSLFEPTVVTKFTQQVQLHLMARSLSRTATRTILLSVERLCSNCSVLVLKGFNFKNDPERDLLSKLANFMNSKPDLSQAPYVRLTAA